MKRLFLLILLLGVSLNAQTALRWGADGSGGAPYIFADPQNPSKYIGYEKEIASALSNVLNLKEEYVPTDWESLADSLVYFEEGELVESGVTDAIILSPADERTRYYLEHF